MGGYVPKKADLRDPQESKSLAETDQLDQVMKLLDNELKGSSKSGKFEFWTYKKLVENLLADTPYKPADENKRSDVFIWGTLESRTQKADICILAGLNEGTWPGFHKDNFWLNRSMRAVLGLDLLERKIGLSAHDFQQGAMAKTLILSRSLRDRNVPTVPSRWLARLENLLDGLGNEGKKCLSDIRSRGQMLIKLVQELYSSDFLVNGLPDELKVKARRPAPVPPIAARPNRLSVTEIETLIKNPYAIYAKKVLNLKKFKNTSHTPDFRNKGLLLHTTLEEFISENIDILPDQKKSCDLLRDKFKLILTRSKIPIEVRNVWIAQFNNRVDSIVASERERRLSGKPVALEISAKYLVLLKGNNEFLITAKADRIDLGNSGVTIYDYKTGQITKKKLEKFSPQLDIEALMLTSGSFGKAFEGADVKLALVGLGSDSKQYKKVVTTFDLKLWQEALIDIIERMKLELSPFVARLIPPNQNTFSDDYEHLSRFGEWNDNDDLREVMVRFVSEESSGL